MVVVEYLGMGNGIGYKISTAFQQFSFEGDLAWTFAFTIHMFFIEFGAIKPIEISLNRWRIDVEGAEL